jgi:hypothetical protein
MPSPVAEDVALGGRLKAAGIRVDGYEWIPVSRPAECHLLIRTLVKEIYKDLGWL